MIDRFDSCRLRRAFTVLLLFMSQFAATMATAQPTCPDPDCEDEVAVVYAATLLAEAQADQADQADHPPACQVVTSTCSLSSPGMPAIIAAGIMVGGISHDLVRDEPPPVGFAVPPPYGPPRT